MLDLRNCDNMDLMRSLPSKSIDLAIVDPPYGINAPNMQMGQNLSRIKGGYPGQSVAVKLKKGRLNAGSGKLKNRNLNTIPISWDYEKPSPEYFQEVFRVSKNQIIWGGNYFDLGPTRCFCIWNKLQPWDNFSQAEFAWTSFDKPAKLFTYSNTGGRNNEEKIHPTQKPVALYKWLLDSFAEPGMKILDTHLGSASIAIACHFYGCDLLACEIDKTYYTSAIKRVEDRIKESPLFTTPSQPLLFGQ